MRLKFTFFYILLFTIVAAGAQDLTGIWRGYFVQYNFGLSEDRYKFEIQMLQDGKSSMSGVTYSYRTTVFYGKADLQGIFNTKTKNLIFKENKLMEVKISDNSDPCLMTCYLDYDKMGRLETLTGTYTSKNVKSGMDCGNGKVYLEKVTTSDFYKEDFLVKRENELKKKQSPTGKKPAPQPTKPKVPANPAKPQVKPGAEDNLITKEKKPEVKIEAPAPAEKMAAPKVITPKPDVLKKRANELVKRITIPVKEIEIELYDNGEIDGDTISVYHNNVLIISKKRLTNKPIRFTIRADDDTKLHEFVMVAENLGSIPPNTALMVIKAGGERHELFITSTERKNAVVVVEYKPGEDL